MLDMLVKLYTLPELEGCIAPLREQGVLIRTAMAYEKPKVVGWVGAAFGPAWAGECDVAFANRPISCFIATQAGAIAGFACYDSTCRDYFGPVGVATHARRRGVGTALLLTCLHTLRTLGYGYAIVGGVGEDDVPFYQASVGALPIAGSSPAMYRDRLT